MKNAQQFPSFSSRLTAALIDEAFLDFNVCWVVLLALVFIKNPDPFALQLSLVSLRLVFSFLYFICGTFIYGTTLGKRVLRIRVVSEIHHKNDPLEPPISDTPVQATYSPLSLKQSILRWGGYLGSYLVPIAGGFFMVLFNSQRHALHDLIAGTVCIRMPEDGSSHSSERK